MIAQARSAVRTAAGTEEWALVQGTSEEDVLEQLRIRAVMAVGLSLVFATKLNAKRSITLAHIFDADGVFSLPVEIKWSDTAEPRRHVLTVRKDEMLGDLLSAMLTGETS